MRAELKRLDRVKQAAFRETQSLTDHYIKTLGNDRGIYISDHAIVRYLERIKHIGRLEGMTDDVYMHGISIPLEEIRDEMITLEEDRKILKGQKAMYVRGDIVFIIKELTVVTVLNKI